jgi:hypothetical protein
VNDCDRDKQQIANKDYETQPINKKQKNTMETKHKAKTKNENP